MTMELTIKLIPAFFVLLLLANYLCLLSLKRILVHDLPGSVSQRQAIKTATKPYYVTMGFMYAAVIGIALIPHFQPRCTSEKKYPLALLMVWALALLDYVFLLTVFCNREKIIAPIVEEQLTDSEA